MKPEEHSHKEGHVWGCWPKNVYLKAQYFKMTEECWRYIWDFKNHLEEVQKVDNQRIYSIIQTEQSSKSRLLGTDLLKSKVSIKVKAIEEKMAIAELLGEAEIMEKRRTIETKAEKLQI